MGKAHSKNQIPWDLLGPLLGVVTPDVAGPHTKVKLTKAQLKALDHLRSHVHVYTDVASKFLEKFHNFESSASLGDPLPFADPTTVCAMPDKTWDSRQLAGQVQRGEEGLGIWLPTEETELEELGRVQGLSPTLGSFLAPQEYQSFLNHKKVSKRSLRRSLLPLDKHDPDLELYLFAADLFPYGRGQWHNNLPMSRQEHSAFRLAGPPSVATRFELCPDWIFYQYSNLFVDKIVQANRNISTGTGAGLYTEKERQESFTLSDCNYIPPSISQTQPYLERKRADLIEISHARGAATYFLSYTQKDKHKCLEFYCTEPGVNPAQYAKKHLDVFLDFRKKIFAKKNSVRLFGSEMKCMWDRLESQIRRGKLHGHNLMYAVNELPVVTSDFNSRPPEYRRAAAGLTTARTPESPRRLKKLVEICGKHYCKEKCKKWCLYGFDDMVLGGDAPYVDDHMRVICPRNVEEQRNVARGDNLLLQLSTTSPTCYVSTACQVFSKCYQRMSTIVVFSHILVRIICCV